MASRNLNYYLMKIARITGWLLFFLVLLYILTGFSLCGKLGFGRLIDLQTALSIHKIFDWPLVAVFLVHSLTTIYFAFRRWGWIKKRTKA
jgi:succinate dehydrogenase/fumarate reductase cytochrome b subunit